MATGRRGGGAEPLDDRGPGPLTGGGPSQLGVDGAMRARDVSRPAPTEIADAEETVEVSYRPRSQPRRGGQPAGNGGSSPDPS